MYKSNVKHLPLEAIEHLHKNYALLEKFWLSDQTDSEYKDSLLEQLETAIYQTANEDIWRDAAKHIEALKSLCLTAMDTASNSAKYILKKAC